MKKFLRSKAGYLLVFTVIAVLIATIFPTTLSGGSGEQVQAFVTRFYVHCLNRQPDPGGLDAWVQSLLSGAKTGADVGEGFVLSEEFQGRNYNNESVFHILFLFEQFSQSNVDVEMDFFKKYNMPCSL